MPPNNLGPLPKGDRSDDLQQLSLDAFRTALPKVRFLFRDERVDDKGVDGAIELKIDGQFTNFRAQVQLKGTDSLSPNADGSFSLQVATSNLNYLLNGQSPLYILWIAPRNELRFLWARDERQRLDASNSGWIDQEKVTLRFEHVLTPAALEDIHARILREGRMQREAHTILMQATLNEPVVLGINPRSLAVTDPDKIYDLLNHSGLSLTAAGYAAEVLQLLPLLKLTHVGDPRIQLVAAYAHVTKGDYMTAGGYLARCTLAKEKLSDSDRHFLASLQNTCKYHVGLIDYQQYLQGEQELAKTAPPEFAMQHELEVQRREHLNTQDPDQRRVIWHKLHETVARIVADANASRAFKLRARLVQLYADALESGAQFTHSHTRLLMRKEMGFAAVTAGVMDDLRQISDASKPLIEQSEQLLHEAIAEEHPLLYADALVTQAAIIIHQTANDQIVAITVKQDPPSISQQTIAQLRQRLEVAATIFARADCLELEIWAKLFLADWLEVAGDTAEARKIAGAVHAPAIAMGYQKQISRAEDHLSGKTEYQKTIAFLRSDWDVDEVLAAATDEQTKRFAAHSLKVMELPEERLPVVERDWLAMRDMAREKMRWCRHLEMIQDVSHTSSPQTMYWRDPTRWCICKKLNYKSNIDNPDASTVILAFKTAYCADCSVREPKASASPVTLS